MNLRQTLHKDIKYPNSIFTGNRTYSSLFLPPAFDIVLDEALTSLLVNSYLDDAGLKHLFKRPYFLLIKTKEIDRYFAEVDSELRKNSNFRYRYFVGTNYEELLFMYVFECPESLNNDYDRFVNGKYSNFSTAYKNRFARVVPDSEDSYIESPLWGVIYKTGTLKKQIEELLSVKLEKEQEYFGKPDKSIETFMYKI